jgi:hypothetical protein
MDEVEEDDDDLPELSDRVALEDTAAVAPLFKDDDVVGEMAKSFLGDDCIEQENILEAAGNHVRQAKGIRHFVQHATEYVVHCRCEEVPHADREYVIVCDYAQNTRLPHCGGEQPGEIYYFSPLTINLFGIFDLSFTPNKLNCYAYREFTAKKGSNNVASLLMQDLFDKLWLRKGKPGKKLTVVMDNCDGQNKNIVVMRRAPYLVDMGYFKTVVVAFYVRRHTKNACNRIFNQMKLKYHKKDFFTWTQAVETLNTKDTVNIVDAKEELFKDYGSMLDKLYSSFKPTTIQKNHIFKVEHTDATLSMQCAIHNEAPFVMQPMLKKGQELGAARRSAIDA